MASSNLLSSELARRNREILDDGSGINAVIDHKPQEAILMQKSCKIQSEWKDMVLYQSSQCQQQLDQNPPSIESCNFSMALDNIIHQEVEDHQSSDMGRHVSNPSSLVTSLSSSREESPDHKTNLPMLFAMPSTEPNKLLATIPTSDVDSWEPSAHLIRPVVSLPQAQMPLFAAWTDG